MIDAEAARKITTQANEMAKELDVTMSYWHSGILEAATLGRNHYHIPIKVELSPIALVKLRELGFDYKREAGPDLTEVEGFHSYRVMW